MQDGGVCASASSPLPPTFGLLLVCLQALRMRKEGIAMPNVTVEWLDGRTVEQKRKVIAGITDLLVEVAQARREAVQVTFRDMHKQDWGRGGLLAIDRTDVTP
jgi:4-oxalocrotonate tautomerase